ncbi:hypothetical protein GE061_005738 [Apolygus lucorum]|uniref:Uncharacterized protein n=1 Tax=Apolygus lucorum TaxID=248454 RepID=A0A8S9WYX0_APOLU|nr:hypothetical protein GE061_005738 [Apolygus lucorum]
MEGSFHCRPKERRNVRIRYYRCFRDGHFYAKGKGLRHLKMKGSVKIDSVCPAMIKAEEDKATGVIRVSYIHTHVGHLQELGRLNLSKSERAEIAQKVAMGIPYGTILDTIRESVKNQDVGRLHLTTRKDIWNVQSSFGLMGTEKGFIHGSDRTSVEVWVAQMQKQSEIVRFYKPQGACMPEEPDLHENDMVLIIATDAQIEMLLKLLCVVSYVALAAMATPAPDAASSSNDAMCAATPPPDDNACDSPERPDDRLAFENLYFDERSKDVNKVRSVNSSFFFTHHLLHTVQRLSPGGSSQSQDLAMWIFIEFLKAAPLFMGMGCIMTIFVALRQKWSDLADSESSVKIRWTKPATC